MTFWMRWMMRVASIWLCLQKGTVPSAHLNGWRFIRRVPELIGCPILSMPSDRRWGGWQYRKPKCPADSFEMSPFRKMGEVCI